MPDSQLLSLDAVGGTRVSGLQETSWQCENAELRSLDMAHSPQLVMIDLRSAPCLHHLTIQDCPALEAIYLPGLGRVTLHLDAGWEPPYLRVMGGLEHIDACWQDGRFAADCEDLAPWQNAIVGDSKFVNRHGQEADLQIIIGEYAAEPASASNGSVRSPCLRHLLVIDCLQLQRLEVSPEAERLETFAETPYIYFLKYVLDVEPLDEPALDDEPWLNALRRGSILHATFESFMTTLQKRGERPTAEHEALLDTTLREALNEEVQRVAPPSEVVEEAAYRRLWEDALVFLQSEAEHCRTHAPQLHEVGFGFGPYRRREGDLGAVSLTVRGHEMELRGRIDRVDALTIRTVPHGRPAVGHQLPIGIQQVDPRLDRPPDQLAGAGGGLVAVGAGVDLAFGDEARVDQRVEVRVEPPVVDLRVVVGLEFALDREPVPGFLGQDRQDILLKRCQLARDAGTVGNCLCL